VLLKLTHRLNFFGDVCVSYISFIPNFSNFFDSYGKSKKEDSLSKEDALSLLEAGRPPRQQSQKNFITDAEEKNISQLSTCSSSRPSITAKEIHQLAKARFCEPNPPPRGAVENPNDFLPKFELILEGKYLDKEGKTIDVIGNAALEIIANSDMAGDTQSIADLKTIENLELLSADPRIKSVSEKIDTTATKLGSAYLVSNLCKPSASIEQIGRRCDLLKSLTADPDTVSVITGALNKSKEGEINLLSTKDKQKQTPGTITKSYYAFDPSINRHLNNNDLALDARFLTFSCIKMGASVFQTACGYGLPALVGLEFFHAYTGAGLSENLKQFVVEHIGYSGLGSFAQYMMKSKYRPVRIFIESFACIFALWNEKNTRDWLVADTSMILLLRKILLPIAGYYESMKLVYETLKDNEDVVKNLEHFSHLEDFFSDDQNEEVVKFRNAIQSGFYRPGQILTTWRLLHPLGDKKSQKSDQSAGEVLGMKLKNELDKALLAIGEIDCFISIANSIIESRSLSEKICIPYFMSQTSGPYLELKDFRHPGIADGNGLNSITLGSKEALRGAIITGANGSGKTSLSEAIALSIITSKMGFCFAEEAYMSHFGLIRTSMKIKGSVKEGVSAYQAQCNRGGEIKSAVKESTDNGECSLVIWDEPCSQTDKDEGSVVVMDMIQQYLTNPKVLSVIVTHFTEIAEQHGDKPDAEGNILLKNFKLQNNDAKKFALVEGVLQRSEINAYEIAKKARFIS